MSDLKMLAIDLGASSGRGIVGHFDGEKLTLAENHRFPNEPNVMAGAFCWDIMRIFHEIKNSIRKCALSEDKDIRSIGIDTWGVDYGLIDRNGHLLANPYNYRDARTEGMQEYTFRTVPRNELYEKTGNQIMNLNTVFQLMADLRYDPEKLALAKTLLFTPDLLNYFLTGKKETEYTIASTGALLDSVKRDWAWDLIDRLGLPRDIFTPIAQPGTVVGKLLPQVLEEVGAIDPDVVHVGAHDTASAVVAVPAVGSDFVYISSGTWSLMGSEIPQPIINEESYRYNFTNEGAVGGKIRFLRNIMGLWLEQESRRQWKREGIDVSFDQLSEMACAAKPLQCLIDPSDEVFTGPGNMPRRIAEYCRQTGQHVPENMGETVRCIFDSLALSYRQTVEVIDSMKGSRTPYINIVGGGTKEGPLCQFCADACGRPVYAGPVEATAIGNLCVQGIAAGEIADIAQARQVVRNSFEIKTYEPDSSEMWDESYERFCCLTQKA